MLLCYLSTFFVKDKQYETSFRILEPSDAAGTQRARDFLTAVE